MNKDKCKGGLKLKSITNLSKKVKYIYKDIHKMKKISELIEYISEQSIEKVATLLLIIWVVSPILMMFLNTSIQDVDQSILPFKQYVTSIYWYQILQTTGFLGCILGIIIFSKSILKAKIQKIPVKQYIKNNLMYICLAFMLFNIHHGLGREIFAVLHLKSFRS